MANAFDQFDQQQNPFDRFDEREKSALAPVSAAVSGVNRGALRLLGLPVDTMANVIDLGIAGYGTARRMLGGSSETMPELLDRSRTIMSGDWLERMASKSKLGRDALLAGSQDHPTLHALGMGVGSSLLPVKTVPAGPGAMPTISAAANIPSNIAKTAAMGGASNALAQQVGESTGSTEAAILASMLPQAAVSLSAAGVRGAVRGSDPAVIRDRIRQWREAGVENPSVGLATGNRAVAGIENLLAQTPGAAGTMQSARDRILTALADQTRKTRDIASTNYGATEAGQSIQSGIRDFRDRFKSGQQSLYGKLDQFIPAQEPMNVANTRSTLAALNADIPGAPELSKQFKNSRIMAIDRAIAADTKDTPDILPYEAVKKTRTLVGNEMADGLAGDVPRSKWKPLYGALSDDLETLAAQTGPQAERAYGRANDFTRSGMRRLETIEPFAAKTDPAQAFLAMQGAGKENVSTLRAVKKSLPEQARADVAATVADRMGRARPGKQNELGDAWSPETFLTNWNTLNPKARSELFSGFKNAPEVAANMDKIAKAASMLRDSSQVWANPSGTSANLSARIGMGAVAFGLLSTPIVGSAGAMAAGGAAGGMLTARSTARLLTNPDFVNWLARSTEIPPARAQSHLVRLAALAEQSNDPEFRQDVFAYQSALNGANN